jgi:hypothetical protein
MNVITHSAAYSFYPRSTFISQQAMPLDTRSHDRAEAARQKYVSRGWPMTASSAGRFDCELADQKLRWPGDRFTWKVTLPDSPQDFPETVELNSWRLVGGAYHPWIPRGILLISSGGRADPTGITVADYIDMANVR